jgi:NADH:ubiquinone oxidoreductase subunit 4 (subunit M)
LLLPIAIAMNAVGIFRLFARLFLGRHRTGFTAMADALPRERWILTAAVLFVVLGGLFPNAIVALTSLKKLPGQRPGNADTPLHSSSLPSKIPVRS